MLVTFYYVDKAHGVPVCCITAGIGALTIYAAVQHDTDDSEDDLDPVPMSAGLRRWNAELQVVAPARGYVSAPSSPRTYAAAVSRAQVG